MNKRKISAIVLWLSALLIWGVSWADGVDNFIGITEIDNDKRVKSHTGYLFESTAPGSVVPYSASIILTHRNDYYFLIKRNISEDPGLPIWKVVYQFKLPRIKGRDHIYVGGACRRNGEQDLKIIALVRYQRDKRLLDDVEKAWIINTKSLTIESISPKGIVCVNESFD